MSNEQSNKSNQKLEGNKVSRLYLETIFHPIDNNEEEIILNEPLTNVKEIKLKTIQIHNSFFNVSEELKNNRVNFTFIKDRRRQDISISLPDGFYEISDLETYLNNFLQDSKIPEYARSKIKVKFKYNKITNTVTIYLEKSNQNQRLERRTEGSSNQNQSNQRLDFEFRITCNAFSLLGFILDQINYMHIDTKGITSQYGVKLQPFINYFIHCNLVENTKYKGGLDRDCTQSDILCILPIDKSKRWWETVTYQNIDCILKPNKKEVINSIKIYVTDEDGKYINFNGYPILYELEATQKLEQKNDVFINDSIKEEPKVRVNNYCENQELGCNSKEINDDDEELDCY